MMIRKILCNVVLLLSVVGFLKAQNGGIQFENGDWKQVREKAIQENKLIFIDFYTEWCGPCLSMAEEVFPQMQVGNFYNTHFVNVKMDAEKGEGKKLQEKYKVISYPTFLFIEPRTEEVVHRSSSRQEPETFLFTGRSAITPVLRSPYLEKEYTLGNRTPELLSDYMDYWASIYKRDRVEELVKEYTAKPEFSLQNPKDWQVFVKHVRGIANPHFQQLLNEKKSYENLYGQDEVDRKLYKEFDSNLDVEILEKAPYFKGKDFLLKKNQAERLLRNKRYAEAVPLLDSLMANPGEFQTELCHYLKFTARSVLYGEHPGWWLKKCAEYARYVAYNHPVRQDAGIHYDYVLILEKLIRSTSDAKKYFPASITGQPPYGVKDYSLRSPKLKPKPKR